MQEIILRVHNMEKFFPLTRGVSGLFSKTKRYIRAVDNVSFAVEKGTVLGLVGESGCGKTTTGRCICRLVEPTSGEVYFQGQNILSLRKNELKKMRRKMQIIFQNPYESFDPRMKVSDLLTEPLLIHKITTTRSEREDMAKEILNLIGLQPPERFLNEFTRNLSGGQRQRVAIGRALILKPEFIVADEPVSMLDASARVGILALMDQLTKQLRLSQIFITHDMAIARMVCDRIAVMYLGKIVELGYSSQIVDDPIHPYTKALISSVPVPNPTIRLSPVILKDEIASSENVPPAGCRFHPRCIFATDVCKEKEPELQTYKNRLVACHMLEQCTT